MTSEKGCKITDKKVGLYKLQYIKIDGTNKIIYKKSTGNRKSLKGHARTS